MAETDEAKKASQEKSFPPLNITVSVHSGFRIDPEVFFRHPQTVAAMKKMQEIDRRKNEENSAK